MIYRKVLRSISVVLLVLLFLLLPLSNYTLAVQKHGVKSARSREENGRRAVEFIRADTLLGSTFDLNYDSDSEEAISACSTFLVIDQNDNAQVFDKKASEKVFVSGEIVQMMTALIALEYLDLNETITISEQQMKNVSRVDGNLGLAAGNTVLVEDLLASMLLRGSADSAAIITDETIKRAGAQSFSSLMVQKAEKLEMMSSDYSKCDGIGTSLVETTAMDQYRLYSQILKNKDLSGILQSGVYTVQSYSEEKNSNIADKVKNSVAVMVSGNKFFDDRIKAASYCLVEAQKTSYVYFYHVLNDKINTVFLLWTQEPSNSVRLKMLGKLIDTLSNFKVIDLLPYIQTQLNELTIEKDSESIGEWKIADDNAIYGRYWINSIDEGASTKALDLATIKVSLTPEATTLMKNDDGSYTVTVSIIVNDSDIGKTQLMSSSNKPNESETTGAGTSPNNGGGTNTEDYESQMPEASLELYNDSDVVAAPKSTIAQYGWVIIVGIVAVGSVIIIAIGISIKNKMGQ